MALVMVVSVFACTKAEDKKPGATTDPSTTGGNPPETTDKELPVVDFDGKSFRVSMKDGRLFNLEFFQPEDSENPVQSAAWKRNEQIEDTYNVTIVPVYAEANNDGMWAQTNQIVTAYMNDSDEYDLTATYVVTSGTLVLNTCLIDWNSLEYTNLDASYWTKSINNNFEIDGHIFTAVGDTCVSALRYTYAMMYNRTKGDQRGLTEDIYKKIENKEWTIDYFVSIVNGVHDDIDDVNGPSGGDFYGFQAESATNLDIWPFAFDVDMISQTNDDRLLECVFNNERTSTGLDKIIDLYWNNNGTYIPSNVYEAPSNFIHGRSLFCTMTLDYCFGGLDVMEDHYSILPYPMLDENQETYNTGMMDNYSVLGVPVTCHDPEMSSLIAEAFNKISKAEVTTVIYEESLCKRFNNDAAEGVEMLDMIMAGRKADLAVLVQQSVARLSMMFRDIVNSKTNALSQYFDAIGETVEKQIQQVVAKYREGSEN